MFERIRQMSDDKKINIIGNFLLFLLFFGEVVYLYTNSSAILIACVIPGIFTFLYIKKNDNFLLPFLGSIALGIIAFVSINRIFVLNCSWSGCLRIVLISLPIAYLLYNVHINRYVALSFFYIVFLYTLIMILLAEPANLYVIFKTASRNYISVLLIACLFPYYLACERDHVEVSIFPTIFSLFASIYVQSRGGVLASGILVILSFGREIFLGIVKKAFKDRKKLISFMISVGLLVGIVIFSFSNIGLVQPDWSSSIATETDATETDATETDATKTDATETDATKTDANGTDIAETDVTETDVVETDVVETDVVETDVVETDVVETDVVETDVVETDVVETDVAGTDVIETDVVEADVVEADVVEADATKTDASNSGPVENKNYFSRFIREEEYPITRQEMWKEYILATVSSIKNIILGTPMTTCPLIEKEAYNSHNSFFMVHSYMGIWGLFVVMLGGIGCLVLCMKKKEYNLLFLSITFLIRAMTDYLFPMMFCDCIILFMILKVGIERFVSKKNEKINN